MIKNLDLLLNMDTLEDEAEWDVLSALDSESSKQFVDDDEMESE